MADWVMNVADMSSSVHFGSGWSAETEGDGPVRHRWSSERTATMAVPKPAGQSRVSMAVSGVPYRVPGQLDQQDVWVFVEGAMAGFARLTDAGAVRGIIPESVLRSGSSVLNFSLVIPNAVVPAETGVGNDQRCLGFALQSLTLTW